MKFSSIVGVLIIVALIIFIGYMSVDVVKRIIEKIKNRKNKEDKGK